MPGLVACGRRWEIGSDDLTLPAWAEMWVRFFWLIGISAVFSLHKNQLDPTTGGCEGGELLFVYYIGLLCILALHLVLDITMLVIATRGTVVDPGPRRYMPILLYIKLILHVPELAWTVLGTYAAINTPMPKAGTAGCAPSVLWAVRGAALVGWVIVICLLIAMFLVFDPLGKRKGELDPAAASKVWERRCRLLCCLAGNDEQSNSAFKAIAKLLTDYFQGVDLVGTDIAAGMVLIYIQQQKSTVHYPLSTFARDNPAHSPGTPSSALQDNPDMRDGGGLEDSIGTIDEIQVVIHTTPKEWMNIQTSAHYMKFALANYGWPMYMFMNIGTGCCGLMPHCRCCCCVPHESPVLDDNLCTCHTAAILKMTGIKPQDIIYASFHNRLYEIPFYVALDHKNKAVIVAIRGTLSFKDALVDLTADCEDVDIEGVSGQCHKGIYLGATFIQSTLNNLQILQQAFNTAPNYELVITGHSLGAGAASILALLLHSQYPTLHCFAFSPPGGLLSESLRKASEEYVLSVVVGQDIIPRLSITNMEKLKVQILHTLKECKQPKHRVFATGVWAGLCGVKADEEDRSDRSRLVEEDTHVQQAQYGSTPDFAESLEDAIVASRRTQETLTPLYPPGQILFIMEEEPAVNCGGKPTYGAFWASPSAFEEVLIHPKMLSDHLPDTVLEALMQLEERGVMNPSRTFTHQGDV